MADLVLNGNTSGAITVTVPSVAGSNTLTLPAATDTLVGKATTDTLTNKTLSSPLTMATSAITSGVAVNSTSGTAILFTGIPSWAKRVTVMFNGVSMSGSSLLLIQLGSGSTTTSGYISYSAYAGGTNSAGATSSTSGFIVGAGTPGAATVRYGLVSFALQTGNTWVQNHTLGVFDANNYSMQGGGSISLSGALDRVNITTSNGTDTFDAGSINIMWE